MVTTTEIGDLLYELFMLAIQLGGPMLLISMLVGVIISIIQAATQIHEQTLTFLPKLLIIGVVLSFYGDTMLRALQDFITRIFSML